MNKTKLTHRPGSHKISKLLCIAGVAATGMTLGIAPALATVSCSGSGISPEFPFSAVSGAADFTLDTSSSPKTLTLVLKNTASSTLNPASTLTGVIFDIGANTAILGYTATANPVLGSGSHIYTDGETINDATPLFNLTGSSWTNQKNTSTTAPNQPPVSFGYGVATTGFDNPTDLFGGLFNSGSIQVGDATVNHAIVAATTFPGSIGGSQFPWIQDSLQFVFKTSSSFTEADITRVKFLYGSAGGAPVGSTCISKDYGDAPDATVNTGTDNYNTRAADSGPSHKLGTSVWLGANKPDGDNGTVQDIAASADNATGTNDEDGIPTLPSIFTVPTSVNMTVKATNNTGSNAFLACWIDFNKNGQFENGFGEKATATVPDGSSNTTVPLTFTGYTATAGDTYIRCRIASASGEVLNSTGAANTGEVEDYRVTVVAGGGGEIPSADFGDAPDTGPGSGPGNYVTVDSSTVGDIGPSHQSSPSIFLGPISADDDNGAQEGINADVDDLTDSDDEDGIPFAQIPTLTTTSTSTKMNVTATNQTGNPAYLACWIDFNRNGVFGDNPNELATTLVPNLTSNVAFPLSYSHDTLLTTGNTYIRCRITDDWSAVGQVTPIGPAGFGEVEDYLVNILEPCTTSPISTVPADTAIPQTYLSGITFSVTASGPISDIKSVQCKKMINILPTGMTFTPLTNTGPGTAPYTWGYTSPVSSVQITARRTAAGTSTLACTVKDSTNHECATDPVIVETMRIKGKPVTIKILDGDKPLSVDFQYLKIQNGSPTEAGLSQMKISVNGTKFKLTAMKTNTAYFLNIHSALLSDVANNIMITAKGDPKSMASVLFSDEPLL